MSTEATSGAAERKPQPYELWQRANGDRDEYLRLMREYGHLISASEGGVRPHWWPRPTDSEASR